MAFNIGGLLADPRVLDIGTGLLSQSGYTTTPTTFGQALGGAMQFANQREVERVGLQAAREEMKQRQQRNSALAQIPSLFQPMQQIAPGTGPLAQPVTQTVMPAQTPEGQMQLMGLLAQAAPEQMGGLLGQMFKQPDEARVSTDLNTFRALNPGLTPGSAEERRGYMEFLQLQNPQTSVEALMQEGELQLLREQLNEARMKRETEERTQAEDRAMTFGGIVRDLSHLEEMAEINDRLEGTILESGRPAPDVLRAFTGGAQAIQDLLGIDSSQAAQLKEDFDTFKKYSTDFVVGSLDRLAGGGAITDNKFEALVTSNANIGASPGTNRQIIANNIEALLDGADIAGFDISEDQAKRYRELAARLKGTAAPANPPASALLGPGAAAMPDDAAIDAEINRLMQEIQQLRGGR